MNESLEELRKEWEVGLVPITAFNTKQNAVIIILGDAKNESLNDAKKRYAIHRYFPINKGWNVSVDVSLGSFQSMMLWFLKYLLPKEI